MLIVELDLKDGRGYVSVAVCDIVAKERLLKYFKETGKILENLWLTSGTTDHTQS